jgi:Zn-dependent peptidase ImmA (M78 family)
VTFIPEQRIEALAAEIWQRHSLAVGFDVEQLLDELGLGLVWEPVDDEGGHRVLGQLLPEKRIVVLNERHIESLEEKDGRLRRYTVGHEIGHWTLHADGIRSGTSSLFDGERIWCRDGSRDPIERQAEMFSAALLMPESQLRSALPPPPWRGWRVVYQLADQFLVNVTPMAIRLERLGWMHRNEEGVPTAGLAPAPGQQELFSG